MLNLSHSRRQTLARSVARTKLTIKVNVTPGRLVLTPRHESADDPGGVLRRFGMALTRDDRLAPDERAARALVDSLASRALLAARGGEGREVADPRLRLFCLFIRLYRRHARRTPADEAAPPVRWSGADGRDSASHVQRAVRSLPLELREALLLVVLERFSHVEAAQALDISLVTFVERLARARVLLTAGLTQQAEAAPEPARPRRARRGAPHLRLVE
jgi:RNA polymerase sigma-70 factor (ECF subfamily)